MIGLVLGGLVTVATLGFYAALAAKKASEGSTIAIYVLIAIGAVVLLGGVAVVLALVYNQQRGRAQSARWLPRIDALVDQLGAQRIPPSQLFRWSERWWRDGLSPEWLRGTGPSRVMITAPVAGFPVAASAAIDAQGALEEPVSPHLVWLLAARLPRDAPYRAKQADVARLVADLRAVGLEVQLRTGGLAMLAERAMIERLAREPDLLAYLAPLTQTLAQLAHRLGAEPPTPSAS